MKPFQSALNFLDDSLNQLKKMLENSNPPETPYFDRAFIIQLKTYSQQLDSRCELWNNDVQFIQQLNGRERRNSENNVHLKTQHFLLSDFIQLSKKHPETEKSRFVLAYFYDVLKNKHFASESSCTELNQLVITSEFKNHLAQLKDRNSILFKGEDVPFSFDSTLNFNLNPAQKSEISHWQNVFLTFAFNTKKVVSDLPKTAPVKQEEKPFTESESVEQKVDTLEMALADLDALVGLTDVKRDVRELINLVEVQKRRKEKGLKNIEMSLHTVFSGPPGTGKTSVARLLGRIFKHLGILTVGDLYETDREGLVAGYVGQTAIKVNEIVEKSLGSVLFVDEAYALTQNTTGSDYGDEAVNTLLKRMEDHRDDFVVIVAGYTEPMKEFVQSNPGLSSRFSRYFYFNHFSTAELLEIFESFCSKSDFVLTSDAKEKLSDTFDLLVESKDESFGNARYVRNLFEKCVQNQANRVVSLKRISKIKLKTLEQQDIPEPRESINNQDS